VANVSEDEQQPASRQGWAVGRLVGVPIQLRPSALLTLGLLWWILYLQLSPPLALRSWWIAPLMATVTTAGFGASILVHELAHAVVARALRLPVSAITIFHLGGVTELGREPQDWRDETLIAAAGPLVNLTLAGGLLAAGTLLGSSSTTGVVLVLLGYLNASIGVFNLLPGHPLDGGSLLRAGAWAVTGDAEGAMKVSSRLGQALGLSMLVGGVLGALPLAPGGGDASWLWLALVGAFVLNGARAGVIRATVRSALAGVRVADLARTAAFDAAGSATVATVVAAVARAGAPGVVVDDGGTAIGTFGPDQLAEVPQGLWSHLTISESMRPVVGVVGHDEPVLEVVAAFRGARDAVLAVTRAGRPIGTLAAEDVLAHVDDHAG
jgi:Zn-dependent protease/predicted transcriptional regulator